MNLSENSRYILATIGVLLLGAGFTFNMYGKEILSFVNPAPKEVHVHADFAFYIADNKVDLTSEQYQSTPESVKHPTMHFHDGVDNVLHRHAEGITLGDFMNSVGIELSDTCTKLATGEEYCSNEDSSLLLFVNKEKVTDIDSYIIQEEDRILLYYGNPDSPQIAIYQDVVTDESCMYSGTCPERGEAPFESCGLTCEVTKQ